MLTSCVNPANLNGVETIALTKKRFAKNDLVRISELRELIRDNGWSESEP